jgi:hypothetical protein
MGFFDSNKSEKSTTVSEETLNKIFSNQENLQKELIEQAHLMDALTERLLIQENAFKTIISHVKNVRIYGQRLELPSELLKMAD